jgi:mannose-1-phosphate guanylyltransferase/mannose-1-phosphate guanylyltransferase/mannose-6-phosphate isomerase
MRIHPVILSGGSGSRLWPLSRPGAPKQFLALNGPETLLQDTARRLSDPRRFERLRVIARVEHRFQVAEQLRAIGFGADILLEPVARNTAAAAAVAALAVAAEDPEGLVLLAPADHVIADPETFLGAVEGAAAVARAGRVVLFGVEPDRAATGYGYIRRGAVIAPGVEQVAAFVEKPEQDVAKAMLRGGHLWNSGVFLFQARTMLIELDRWAPDVLAAARGGWDRAERDADFVRLAAKPFAAGPSIAVDRAVMERTDLAAVAPVACGWSDVGAWSALWEVGARDAAGNVAIGPVRAAGAHACYLRSDGPQVAAVGVDDLVVVAANGAVLVMRRGADQALGALVPELQAADDDSSVASGDPRLQPG